jgi:mycofactocin precursor
MDPSRTEPSRTETESESESESESAELVTESLVEEVSIDGMCGVY